MQFKIGDVVVHPAYGLGYIVQIEAKQLSKKEDAALYYQGTFGASPTISVWIPVETSGASGLRAVTSKSDLDQYRDLLKIRPTPPSDKPRQRHVELTRRLKQGSFQVMCEIVRDLTLLSRKKTLAPPDAVTLKKTRENLLQEWAVAAGISIGEATEEVKSLLWEDSERIES